MKNCQTARLASFLSAALLMFSLTVHSMPASAAESAQNSEEKAMNRMQRAEKNRQKFLGEAQSPLARTDPDLIAMKDGLLYGEIVARGTLNDRQRMLVTLVALAASQTLEDMKAHTEAALRVGLSPVEIKEALYQCAPYIGFPKTESAVRLVNEVFAGKGIALPGRSQGTVTEESRFRDGLAALYP